MNANKALAVESYRIFQAQLSASGRVHLFSANAWEQIFATARLMLTLNDFRDSEMAIQLGKKTPVDYIAIGQVLMQNQKSYLTIEWINLHNGLIEKSYAFYIDEKSQLTGEIAQTVQQILRCIIKTGRIIGQTPEGLVQLKVPELSGWLPGDEFFLVNSLDYPYARVRLIRFSGTKAFAEYIYRHDQWHSEDRAVIVTNFKPQSKYRPLAYLWPIKGISSLNNYQDIYYAARQLILDSGKFDLIEERDKNAFFSFRFFVEQKANTSLYLVNLSVKKFPDNTIIYEKNQDCIADDVRKTAEILLALALNRWELTVQVTEVNDSFLMIDEGKNRFIRKGQELFIKEPENESIIAKGKVKEVFAHSSIIEIHTKYFPIRAGCLAIFPSKDFKINKWRQELQSIDRRAREENRRINEQWEQMKELHDELERNKLLSEQAKPGLRMGYSYPIFKSTLNKEMFNSKSTAQFDVDFYFGTHPYFNFVLNYNYIHLSLLEDNGYIYANSVGLGGKLQLPLFSPISVYGIALVQYSYLQNRSIDMESVFPEEQWTSSYICIRAGLDISFNSALSLYLEGGQRRKIKTKIIDLEYYSASAGLALWF